MSTKSHPTAAHRHRPFALLVLLALLALAPGGALATPAGDPASSGGDRRVDVRPAPPPAATALVEWHRRYLPRAAAVRVATRRLLAARREAEPTRYKQRYRAACAALGEATAPFLDPRRREELYPAAAADPAARYHLRRAYAGLALAAEAGAEGRYQAAELAFADAARWFRQAARVLARYGLEP